MTGGKEESVIPEKIKWALVMGLLTVFFCLFLADGVLMMKDNWYGWVVFGIAIVLFPWLFRKKMGLKELWTVDFLFYTFSSGVLSIFFGRGAGAGHRVFLILDQGSMIMPATGVLELRTALYFCCIQSMIWIPPIITTIIKEIRETERIK